MWGIIPAAGVGSRIQPLAFSKELLPVGSRLEGEIERPRAVSEYLVERMLIAGADKICFVISPGKSDIFEYYGASIGGADICYVVQQKPGGLCDAIFRARRLIGRDESVLIGLPDTIWFPEDGLSELDNEELSFLLFPVDRPEFFDAVVTDREGNVLEIQVKQKDARSDWIWGAFKMPGSVLHKLYDLWCEPGRLDEYVGTLVNAYLARGGHAQAVRAGQAYVDVGTLHGYREAIKLLSARSAPGECRGEPRARPGHFADPREGQQASPLHRTTRGHEKVNMAPPPSIAEPPVQHPLTREQIEQRVQELAGEMGWFHNINLQGVWTAPNHFLGDYPGVKFRRFAHALPADLRSKSVLDIGCNGGFYSIEMKRRGADRVVGIDTDERYLRQARFAAEVSGFPDIEFREIDVYHVAEVGERFDLVLFMGVLYHLRHPLLALDLIHEHVVNENGLLLFQSMQRGSRDIEPVQEDYPFTETGLFDRPGFPKLHFIEHKYASDVTNWWIPNRACAEAMLRSAGFAIVEHPEDEVYVCRRFEHTDNIGGPRSVYPARGGIGTATREDVHAR